MHEVLVATSDFGYSYALDFDKCENFEKAIPYDFSDHLGTVTVVEVDDQSSVATYTLAFKTTAIDQLKPLLQPMLQAILDGVLKKAPKSVAPQKHTLTAARVLPFPAATVREILSFANAAKLLGADLEVVGDGADP